MISSPPSLSLTHHLQPPIGNEPLPRRSTRTPSASHSPSLPHHSLSLSPKPTGARPLETKASTASQPLLPRQSTPRDTTHVAQPEAADHATRRPLHGPRSDRAAHAPWTPRACIAFLLVHACSPPQPHTSLHGIEHATPRHPCPARSSTHSPWPCHDFGARLLNPGPCPLAQLANKLRTHTPGLSPRRRPQHTAQTTQSPPTSAH
jgi:hypothetical protein